jgi:hypothetical protein
VKSFLSILRAALSRFVLRRPRLPAAPIGALAFWGALVLVAALGALDDFLATSAPRTFDADGLRGLAFHALLALALGGLLARFVVRRPRLVWLCAALLPLLAAFSEYALRPLEGWLLEARPDLGAELVGTIGDALWVAWIALALTRALRWLAPQRPLALRALAAVAFAAALVAPRYLVSIGAFFGAAETAQAEPAAPTEEPADETADEPAAPPSFDTERVMAAQPALLADKVTGLAPQRPGQVDLYFVAFGGDAEEDVFRNEVEYAQRLFERRFDAAGRTLVLLNHDRTTADTPLATRANLRSALESSGRIIDRDEDIVMLFLTTHGSVDHELYVKLGPLPLYGITPADLRSALDDAGIKHRVVVVSACYSGGFIPALKDEHTMVIAAARADRPSFGCGSESDLTYFGHAFLVDALNRTEDFTAAFAQAREEIAQWETEQEYEHSYPEIASTPAIERQLARWRKQLRAGFPLPFRPAGEKSSTALVP